MENRNRAQDLRRRLNDHGIDLESLARAAATLFEVAGRPVAARWLTLELQGYGSAVDHAPLHEVLGVEEGDRLAVHVSAYRAQQGRIVTPAPRAGQPFRHFFVESIRELSEAAQRLRASSSIEVQLDFDASLAGYPTAGAFPANVFDRVLLGFRAALHLQLGSIAE